MLPIERELAIAIWALYGIDCVHWLKPGGVAFTRNWRQGWSRHPYREEAFTLLGRMPVAVNPLDLRPCIVIAIDAEASTSELGQAAYRDLDNLRMLHAVSWIAAFNLLLLVPALLLKGWFDFFWQIPAAILVTTHAWILLEVFFRLRRWRRETPGEFWPEFVALVLNPVGAVRAGDLFSKRLMANREEAVHSRNSQIKKPRSDRRRANS